jgi:L-fuconolactonase
LKTPSDRIDSHQHFWRYEPVDYSWIADDMAVLKRDFLPAHLSPLLSSAGFHGCVAVQARQSTEETDFLLGLAAQHDFIRGVIGWVDLKSEDVSTVLRKYSAFSKFRGVRHVLQDEPDDEFMLQPNFKRGIAALREFNLTYDLLVFPRQLQAAATLVEAFPNQPFVLDHIGKPPIKTREIEPWRTLVERLAKFPNVFCKLSGMVTEAIPGKWAPLDFHPYLEAVIAAFGLERVMIGSDWPVCLLSGEYKPVLNIVIDYIKQFSNQEQAAIVGGNCLRFYGI